MTEGRSTARRVGGRGVGEGERPKEADRRVEKREHEDSRWEHQVRQAGRDKQARNRSRRRRQIAIAWRQAAPEADSSGRSYNRTGSSSRQA